MIIRCVVSEFATISGFTGAFFSPRLEGVQNIINRTLYRPVMTAEKFNQVPEVEIEEEGTFKYVLIKVYGKDPDESDKESKLIVRGGSKYGPYHSDIYDDTLAKIQKLGLDSECLGGGRICHEPAEKKLNVYGYSQGYGQADHCKTTEILKKKYTDYDITCSNEGY